MGKPSKFNFYLERFKKFYHKNRIIPSFSQCMDIMHVQSKSVVHRFFQQMIERWYLEKRDGIYYPHDKLFALPLFDAVRAGNPSEVISDVQDMVSVESYLIDSPADTVLLSVIGESMIDAGMCEWDVVIVDTTKKERIGDIVIAVVDGEYTVKFLQKDHEWRFFLEPANTNFSNIYPENELQIFGVVVGSFRKYV